MFGFGRSATFLLLALLAEIAGTVGGFGSSVFFVPIANFYFDFQSVLGITALFHLASNVSKLGLFRGGIDRGLLLRLLLKFRCKKPSDAPPNTRRCWKPVAPRWRPPAKNPIAPVPCPIRC